MVEISDVRPGVLYWVVEGELREDERKLPRPIPGAWFLNDKRYDLYGFADQMVRRNIADESVLTYLLLKFSPEIGMLVKS